MKLWLAVGTLALASLALPHVAAAQNTQDAAAQSAQDKDNPSKDSFTHTLKGCLKQGPNASAYALTDENGKLWDLRSRSVSLSDNVNKMVTIKGHLPKSSKGNGNDTTDNPDRDNRFIVTSVHVDNQSCVQP